MLLLRRINSPFDFNSLHLIAYVVVKHALGLEFEQFKIIDLFILELWKANQDINSYVVTLLMDDFKK